MNQVFTEKRIANLVFKNRFVHSATHEGIADDNGCCNDEIIELNRKIAAGGVAANIVSFAYVNELGKCLKGQIGIHNDDMIPGLEKMASAIKNENCKAIIQIGHAGCHANSKYSGGQSMGPSEMSNLKGGIARPISKFEIEEITEQFVKAALRAKKTGFDAVQLHMAHGYLLCSFLSPHYNHRDDEYGGSAENRIRFPSEVLRAVKDAVGKDYPIFIKLNSEDGLADGMTYELMTETVKQIEKDGACAVELSGGCGADGALWPGSREVNPKTPAEEGYFRKAAPYYHSACNLPLILVGGNRSIEGAEEMVSSGVCDFISISRPLIREPNLINRWMSGDSSRAKCVSCNLCRDRLFSGQERILKCPFNK